MNANQGNLFTELHDDYPTSYLTSSSSALHITQLKISNFKRIRETEIQLAPFSVLTGVNNSGKSTILQAAWVAFECLRLCVDRESWQISHDGRALAGFDFLPANEPRDLWYAQKYRRGNKARPISIRVELSNGFFFEATINLYFGAINVKIADWNESMGPDATKEVLLLAPMLIPGHVEISPHEERRVPAQIHKHALSSQLSPIIRNVLLSLSDSTPAEPTDTDAYTFDFVANAITRHFGISLEKLVFDPERDLEIRAPYSEENWNLDIVSAGSGLHQILKLAAFIAWRKSRIILLDEPDAHLHTSLQVRLASFLERLAVELGVQIIIATHSRDLIAQAPIESVIPVDSNASHMKPIENVEHLLSEYRRLGAISNMDLALLYQTKRCLFVEGSSDRSLLPSIAARLELDIFTGANQAVICEFKGAGKFTMVKDLTDLFQKMIGAPVTWYVLRDRDSSTDTMLDHMKEEAKKKGIEHYHIWERYSLENYLLDLSVILPAVQDKASSKGVDVPTENEIRDLLAAACDEVLKKVRSSFITSVQGYYVCYKLVGDNPQQRAADDALKLLESANNLESQLRLLPGPQVFGHFVQKLQAEKGLSIRIEDLVQHLSTNNAADELKAFFDEIGKLHTSDTEKP